MSEARDALATALAKVMTHPDGGASVDWATAPYYADRPEVMRTHADDILAALDGWTLARTEGAVCVPKPHDEHWYEPNVWGPGDVTYACSRCGATTDRAGYVENARVIAHKAQDAVR